MSEHVPSTRQIAILEAAIQITGTTGIRGLTHRAVDRQLGIAEGSTSAYYRTRDALITASGKHIVELNLEAVNAVDLAATTRHEAAERLAAMYALAMNTDNRVRQRARFEFSLEASRNKPLQDDFVVVRDRIIDQTVHLLTDAGCTAPDDGAAALAAFINGLIWSSIVYAEPLISPEALAGHFERILGAY